MNDHEFVSNVDCVFFMFSPLASLNLIIINKNFIYIYFNSAIELGLSLSSKYLMNGLFYPRECVAAHVQLEFIFH